MKFKILLILVLLVNQNLRGQVICSKHHPKILFGPENVIFEKSNPSEIYRTEIRDAIDNLNELSKSDGTTMKDKSEITEVIKALQAINQDWIKWSRLSKYSQKSESIIEVKEFLYIKEIENKKAMSIRVGHSIEPNCLRSNPNDCIFYGRIKKWEIKIEDDFGNVFIPDYHKFSNVGMDEYKGVSIFYRKRKLTVQ